MARIYIRDDDEKFQDEEKPIWDEDINIDDIAPPVASSSKEEKKGKRRKTKEKNKSNEDGDYRLGDGDEAYGEGGEWDDEEWDGTEEMRKKKLEKYMDSLLELEFNDMASAIRVQSHHYVPQHPSGRLLESRRDSSTSPPDRSRSG